ncbi:YjbQ family protein [Nocardioides sp. zg-536]|uniref:YjbQ family protein n=1 Tax=Nocardioides faecalis TaxID=2803858 RepID=A0A938YD20_9ACTN|nr:YjbQ family protein [Nocardioides faecalis]MBM9461629.1 YjbQ family protein [Nocardioides faecalis]MBS4753745.1 YjbQ family protein [Nocardioides faecalis]QVI57411.1 YjbQ family protein [Nocardioides faecalis]
MDSQTRTYRTGGTEVVLDLTSDCADYVARASSAAGTGDGLLHVFVPHATAGLAILETGAGSDDDLLAALGDLLPADDRWRHRHGSRGHGRSHVMPALVPPYASVPVLGGRLALGTWQSICLVDLNVDNAEREVRLSFLAG